MKFTLALTTLMFASLAQAEIYTCKFTEPFYTLEVNTEAQTVVRFEPDFENEEGGVKATLIASDIGVAEFTGDLNTGFNKVVYIVGSDGKFILKMTLDGKGSDGMSDFIYPYSAENPPPHDDAPPTVYGGCSTPTEPAREPIQSPESYY